MDTKLDTYVNKYAEIASIAHTKGRHIIIRCMEPPSNTNYTESADDEEVLTSELQSEDKSIDNSLFDFLENDKSSNSDSNSHTDIVILDVEIINLHKEANSIHSNSEVDDWGSMAHHGVSSPASRLSPPTTIKIDVI